MEKNKLEQSSNSSSQSEKSSVRDVNWLYVVMSLQIYVSSLSGLHFVLFSGSYLTTLFSLLLIILSILGITAGAHRLWAHHSYEATTSLKIFLMLCQTLSGQTSIYNWVRLHRLHHKYFQTDLDPFNPKKGFIYSHFIASNLKLSARQEELLKEIDMSDLDNDKVVMFQQKFYWLLFVIVTLLLPINAPVEYWGDSIMNSFFIVGWLRLGVIYTMSLLIHSASTVFNIEGDEKEVFNSNLVFIMNKSYWISYHYLTPWDYQTSELGKYGTDCTTKFIRVCAALELASNLKTVDNTMVRKALEMHIEEKKPISECLTLLKDKNNIEPDHYLNPTKYLPVK